MPGEKVVTGRQSEQLEVLLPLVYSELRRAARRHLKREAAGHTLEPTALVHEVYLRLVQQRVCWKSPGHLLGVAAGLMRRVLIDHARKKLAKRRGGFRHRVTLTSSVRIRSEGAEDLLDLEAALEKLERLDARQARIVEMRFYGGLSVEQTAEVIGLSTATVKREWQTAKIFLRHTLRSGA